MTIRIQAYKTRTVVGIRDDLFSYLDKIPLAENSILAISSKIVSLSEGRVVKKTGPPDALIKREAERYIERSKVPGARVLLTLKNHSLTASAGVDEFDGCFVLWPKEPGRSAERICRQLKRERKLKKFGVIITDSHTVPLRRGIIGFALGFYGFSPLRRYAGRKSLFGRRMKMTQANIADGLASAAVLAMGEGGERTPFALITGVIDVRFISGAYRPPGRYAAFNVPMKDDIYRPLLLNRLWRKN